MKRILQRIGLAFSALLLSGGLTFAAAAPALAQSCDSGVGKGISITTEDGSCTDNEGESFSAIVKKVINILSVVVGAVSVIMIIIGGFRYVVSNGDSNGVQGAKNTILYAIVGLVIVLFAQLIVRFVFTSVAPETT